MLVFCYDRPWSGLSWTQGSRFRTIDLVHSSEGQRDSLTRMLPLGTLEGFVGSKSLAFTLSRTETYRGPRKLAPNKDDSWSKTSVRFVTTIIRGLYTCSLWEKILERKT